MWPDADAPASSRPDLEQLMMRYQQADTTAVAVLVERLSPQLYRFFASQMGNRLEAEDMLQDVWLRIHRVRHTYRLGDPLLPWVYAIARRVHGWTAIANGAGSHLTRWESGYYLSLRRAILLHSTNLLQRCLRANARC